MTSSVLWQEFIYTLHHLPETLTLHEEKYCPRVGHERSLISCERRNSKKVAERVAQERLRHATLHMVHYCKLASIPKDQLARLPVLTSSP